MASLLLQATCDNRTTCDYDYLGSVIDDCEPSYIADFMNIFFSCLPGKYLPQARTAVPLKCLFIASA